MHKNWVFHQERYQGIGHGQPYFEGWYFRTVAQNGRAVSFIPGISKSRDDPHCFIQMIDTFGDSRYFRFPLSKFEYSTTEFYIKIGENIFSSDGFSLDIDNGSRVSGKIAFKNAAPYPKSLLHPGIMGPFSYLPFLECRHQVIYAKCDLEGEISIDGDNILFHGGTGYVEKDWGSSFPNPYIWAQSCCFEKSETSFMISVARVPLMGMEIKGLISFLYLNGSFYRFATYTGAKVTDIIYDNDVRIKIKMKIYELDICLIPDEGQVLKAPACGCMNREIRESGNGRVILELKKDGNTVFCGEGSSAGIEIFGDVLTLK